MLTSTRRYKAALTEAQARDAQILALQAELDRKSQLFAEQQAQISRLELQLTRMPRLFSGLARFGDSLSTTGQSQRRLANILISEREEAKQLVNLSLDYREHFLQMTDTLNDVSEKRAETGAAIG